jgi:hypothetical protein
MKRIITSIQVLDYRIPVVFIVPQYIRFANNFEKLSFFSKFDYSVRFLNSKYVVSLRKTVDECKSCWFANLFSNFLILRALSRKKVPKIRNFICCLINPIIFKNFMKISIFRFYMTV